MNHWRTSGALLIVLVIAGCAGFSGNVAECDCLQQTRGDGDNEMEQRRILNEGYSMVYSFASGLSRIDLTFLAKAESDDVQMVVKDMAGYCGELASKLERVNEDFPAVRIDLDPLPEMEKRKRAGANEDRLLSFAPVVGETGVEFERSLLLTLYSALKQQRFLVRAVKEEEPDTALKEVMANAEQRYAALRGRVVKLLNEQYFKHDTYEPSEQDG